MRTVSHRRFQYKHCTRYGNMTMPVVLNSALRKAHT